MCLVAAAIGGAGLATAGASAYSARQQSRALSDAAGQMDYYRAYRDSIGAQIDSLPDILKAEGEYGPLLQALELAAAERGARGMAETMLEIQRDFGPAFLDEAMKQWEKADPEGAAARRQLAGLVMEDAANAGRLSDPERREVQQAVRGGQLARGNFLGDASTFEEAMMTGEAAWRRRQQAISNLSGFLAGPTPQQGMAQLPGATGGAAPVMPLTGPGVIDRGAAAGGASTIYGGQAALANARLNQPNPWMQGLGMLAGAGTSLAGAYIGGPMAANAWRGN